MIDTPGAARHRKVVLICWVGAVIALAGLGSGLVNRLAPTSLLVPGTPSAHAQEMLDRQFGNSIPVTILLQGPPRAIEAQGPRVAAAFRHEPGVSVMSPWDTGAGLDVLRPKPNAALIVTGFRRSAAEALGDVIPTSNRLVSENVHAPLRAHVGGMAAIAEALQTDALDATHKAELLVTPILILVLLLVFRTPVAAAIPLLMGAATVMAGKGLLYVSTYVMPINSLAVAIASMMGLALGVDYALLMVSRFRQEREAGADPETALANASHAAGRTIVFAGTTLGLAMVTAAFVAPGDLLGSVAAGVVVSTLLSVLLAVSMMPALIHALLPYLERWRLPSFGRGDTLVSGASRLIARPWIAIPLIVAPMLAVAAPAAALTIGPPDPKQLPPSDPTRQGFEALRRLIGPGWAAPIVVVATAKQGPIAAPGRLRAISRWQDRVAHDPDVETVIGPASLEEAEGGLGRLRGAYDTAPARLARAERGIAALRAGLREASGGVDRLRAGLASAAGGATTLAERTRQAQAGAERLNEGVGQAGAGAHRLSVGIDMTKRGAGRLVRGQRRLASGSARLARGMDRLDETLHLSLGQLREISARLHQWSTWLHSLRAPTEMAAERLDRAVQELQDMTVGRQDPRYEELLAAVREASALVGVPPGAVPAAGERPLPPGVPQSIAASIVQVEEELAQSVDSMASLPKQIERLAGAVHRLRVGSDRVAAGARQSERGGRQLHNALRRLSRGGHRLDRGLESAHDGSGRLAAGLAGLGDGADRLAGGLREGEAKTARLSNGLTKPDGPLRHYAVVLHNFGQGYDTLRHRTPGAIDSGYLMLTALDGAVPKTREMAGQVINVDGGGQTTRMMIVPKSGPSAAATKDLSHRLQRQMPGLAKASNTEVGIGQGAQMLTDYTEASMARLPWLIFALCLVSILMLMAVLRSLLLPIVAVGLNLLTIAAALGALQIFFGLDLLVGPRYIDAISASGVITIMFVLSIDYEVFLLTRMRETWLRTGDHRHAIEHGLRSTAGIITGAAVIMSSVFLAFATADIASLQQFGAGLTFAVILDATLIRVVLLPSIMRVLGPRAWWLPGWLDRRLPNIDHGDSEIAVAAPAATAPHEPLAPPQPATPPPPAPVEAAQPRQRELLELLEELDAGDGRVVAQVTSLVREIRAAAGERS
ncbi:MAG TPA: MMPL family transporter [Solirubrobacterales bacterium]|nr:MMPL family transporter [Solirubrobacterales bacterium]